MDPVTTPLDPATIIAQFGPAAAIATTITVAAILASLGVKAAWVAHRAASKGVGKIGG